MSTHKPVIAAFDFDCTITTTDSFRLFFKFLLGSRRYYTMLLRHFWPLAGYALGIVSNERAKGILLRGFLLLRASGGLDDSMRSLASGDRVLRLLDGRQWLCG